MKFPIEMSFELTENFLEKYKKIKPNFGFDGLGEFVYMRTYSRIKSDGKNERWWETVRRVVEGIYSIQRQHIDDYNLGWNQMKAQASAQEMYDRIFKFKMLGSGRSLWAMGTPIIFEKGLTEALFNCSFISTEDLSDAGSVFANIMDFLMLGVGVGTDVRGADTVMVKPQKENEKVFVIPDTREGWVESVKILVDSFFGGAMYSFDYSEIRPEGSPIKTFGGTASGYIPLKRLHDKITEALSENIGENITQKTIANIANLIGVCVVSGNVRRSAEIILGGEDDEFLDLKDYDKNPERADFGWASNNSIISDIGMDYSQAVERTKSSGEPAYVWLDNLRRYGRMNDVDNNMRDHRISGVNPCFSYDTRLLTEDGYRAIGELDGEPVAIVDADGNIQRGKVFESGIKETIVVKFSNKQSITCTPDHEFIDVNGDVVEARNSKGIKILPYLSYPHMDRKYVLYGYMQGDGSLTRLNSKSHRGIEVNIGKNDGDIWGLLSGYKYTTPKEGRTAYLQGSIKQELIKLGFDAKPLPARVLPSSYKRWSKLKKSSFLQGCFSANGCINNRGRITYKTASKKFAEQISKTLLDDFGIISYMTTNKAKMNMFSNGMYRLKESYDINISRHESKTIFYNQINFYHSYKIEELYSQIIKHSPYVSSIKKGSLEKVYDFSLPKLHWGVVEGFVAHNCGEIGLESGELCNLVEVVPSNHEDIDDFKKTLKYAYLFAKSITLLNTGWPNTNKVMLRNRRIGIGLTGISQFVSENGLHNTKTWMEEGYSLIRKYDEIYSDWFAIPQSIKMTTIKPSGSLSLLAGVTAGVHYPQSNFYIRRIRISKNSPLVSAIEKSGYKIEPASEDPENTLVIEFPVKLRTLMKTIDDISIWEQIKLAEFCQRYWADNSVSITVTFDKSEEDDILPLLEYAQFSLKAVSFLPKLDGTKYAQMPYETISQDEYSEMSEKIKNIRFSKNISVEAVGEKYCETDVCEIRTENENIGLSLEELV